MKVFISWSGERSRQLAQALHGWLPLVLHYVKPWLSDNDVAAGDRWGQVVAKELESSNFGIICVTPENVAAPWMLFEAGALAKSMVGAKVVPLLFNLEISDVSGPLAQFQAKKFDKAGLSEAITSINQSIDQPVPEDRARQLFTALWPDLERQLQSIPAEAPTAKHMRPHHEILEELVSSVRGLDGRFREIENAIAEQGPRVRRRRLREFHPMMVEELAHSVSEDGNDPLALLMIAGLFRDDLPWLSEVMVDTYREIRDADPKSSVKAVERLRRLVRNLGRRDMMFELGGHSKELHMMMMEMPRMIDHLLHRMEVRKFTPPEQREEIAPPVEE